MVAGKTVPTGSRRPAQIPPLAVLRGRYSTNIPGNRDGGILDGLDAFRTKEASKLGVLDSILPADLHEVLYGSFSHTVQIDYCPPRGDRKESWDNIDLFGWLGCPMQMKINFLCRDSILAAPHVLDLILVLDLAQRSGPSLRVARLLLQEPDDAAARRGGARSSRPVREFGERAPGG
jgi:myo-inositol-1-phosphate synthase